MESIEKTAKTVDEAIETALRELGLDRSEVDVEILSEGRVTLWGYGDEEARVKVTPLLKPAVAEADVAAVAEEVAEADVAAVAEEVAEADLAAIAKEMVEKLLFLMKIPATVEVREGEPPAAVAVDISGDELGLLIGRRGQTLATFQYLVSLMVSRQLKSGVRVAIDVAGYKLRRQEELQNLALRLAELVKSTKRSLTMEPMSPAERRIVHLALRDDPEVTTQSIGEEENRKVIISLRRR